VFEVSKEAKIFVARGDGGLHGYGRQTRHLKRSGATGCGFPAAFETSASTTKPGSAELYHGDFLSAGICLQRLIGLQILKLQIPRVSPISNSPIMGHFLTHHLGSSAAICNLVALVLFLVLPICIVRAGNVVDRDMEPSLSDYFHS
jgi:hypothetical protein